MNKEPLFIWEKLTSTVRIPAVFFSTSEKNCCFQTIYCKLEACVSICGGVVWCQDDFNRSGDVIHQSCWFVTARPFVYVWNAFSKLNPKVSKNRTINFSFCPQLSVSVKEYILRVGLPLSIWVVALLFSMFSFWPQDGEKTGSVERCLFYVRPNKPPFMKPCSPVRHSLCP